MTEPAHSSPQPPALPQTETRSAQTLAYVDVLDALCELERVERAAIRLIYWHGHTQAQVARELRIPSSAVRSAVSNGMRLLAARLAADNASGSQRS